MHTLTLSHDERKAIDWIGDRYAHGDELSKLLWNNEDVDTGFLPDEHDVMEWDGDYDIEFSFPEHVAWEISRIVEEDNLACFSNDLKEKIQSFCDSIV